MNKEIFIISIHSFVDVITNSSTELFVCDTDKSIKVVRQLVDEMQEMYPNEYGHRLHTDVLDSSDWLLQDIFNCYIDTDDIEDAAKYMRAKGYKIERMSEDEIKANPAYIQISAERGGLNPRVKKFIEDNFNVIHYTTEA